MTRRIAYPQKKCPACGRFRYTLTRGNRIHAEYQCDECGETIRVASDSGKLIARLGGMPGYKKEEAPV
jgi:transposase-like protein